MTERPFLANPLTGRIRSTWNPLLQLYADYRHVFLLSSPFFHRHTSVLSDTYLYCCQLLQFVHCTVLPESKTWPVIAATGTRIKKSGHWEPGPVQEHRLTKGPPRVLLICKLLYAVLLFIY
jgi:hypothetical protein